MRHALVVAVSISILAGATTSDAYAQLATRTWVSGVGDDANPCTRTAPCLTFAGAYSKTEAKGEIDVLDPGSFGVLTISKSITIDGNGVVAGILTTSFSNGIIVDVGNNGVVVLRNLEINGAGVAPYGVLFASGKQLIIENSKIFGFRNSGIFMVKSLVDAPQNLVVSNSTISTNVGNLGSSGVPGIKVSFGTATVSHSVIAGNEFGLFAENTGVINADSNVLTGNSVAVQAGNGGEGQTTATVRLSNNDVYGNLTGFGCGGGVLASAGNNRKGSNTGGTVAACAPNATITQQ